jgi:hypothetical protein
MIASAIDIPGLQFQNVARTRNHTEVAAFAAFLVYNYCSFDFGHFSIINLSFSFFLLSDIPLDPYTKV